MEDADVAEDCVVCFLMEHKGECFSPFDLVRKVSERFPQYNFNLNTIRLAALNLVSKKRIRISQTWTMGLSDEQETQP